jgi:hypothetical protein
VLHDFVEKQISDGRTGEGCSGMAGLRFFNGVNGEDAEGVNGKLINIGCDVRHKLQ